MIRDQTTWTRFKHHLVLSLSCELNKGIKILIIIQSTTRHSHRYIPLSQTYHTTSKWTSNKLCAIRPKRIRALQIASRRSKYSRTWELSATNLISRKLTKAIDLRSICGRLLRTTRINTDRFKQLSNESSTDLLGHCLVNRTMRTIAQGNRYTAVHLRLNKQHSTSNTSDQSQTHQMQSTRLTASKQTAFCQY